MARVKRGVTAHAKHKKVLKAAKGFFGRRKNTIRAAKAAVDKSMQYAYRDRKNRKREFRALWIQRINAAVREHGLTYSRFISGLATAGSKSTARFCPTSPFPSPQPSPRLSSRRRVRCRRPPETPSPLPAPLARKGLGEARILPVGREGGANGFAGRPRGHVGPSGRKRETLAAIESAPDESALEAARVAALGKKGSISALLATLGKLAPDERKTSTARRSMR